MLVCVFCLSASEVSLEWELPSRIWYCILSSPSLRQQQHDKEMLSSWWHGCAQEYWPLHAPSWSPGAGHWHSLETPGFQSTGRSPCLEHLSVLLAWVSTHVVAWGVSHCHFLGFPGARMTVMVTLNTRSMCSPPHRTNRWTVGDSLEERSQCCDHWPFPAPELSPLLPTCQGASRVGKGTTVSPYSPTRTAWAGSCLPLSPPDPCWV